jgi:elongation factor P
MPTIKAGNISKGMFILFRGQPYQVTKAEFYHPGKGSAVNRLKIKNLRSGSTSDFTYKTSEQVEYLEVSSREMQFLYEDGSDVVFMDPRTYEQETIPGRFFEGKLGYLTPDTKVYVQFYEDEPMDVTLPPKVKLKVIEAQDATAGNRVNAPKKPVIMETGLEVQAPIFIKQGEVLIIDTETGEYVSRA